MRKRGMLRAGDYNFFYGKSTIGNKIFLHHRKLSLKRVEFVSDRISYIVLRGRWCNTISLNVREPRQEKSDDKKENFYEELEHVFDHFPKYLMKIALGNFNIKLWIRNIYKPTIENESLYQESYDNSVRIVNFATSKNLVVKRKMFPHRNFISTPRPVLMGRLKTRLITYR